MPYKKRFLLASTALVACLFQATISYGETTVSKTVVESPGGTTVNKTVTETTPDTTSIHTTLTTEKPGLITTETRWKTVENGAHEINFVDFDVNRDGIQSVKEIGEMLFKLYDTDGNEVIDNIEYKRHAVVTIIPMQTDTIVSYDYDGDGKVDETKYTYDTFIQDTMLTRYDKNLDGLSPAEFTGLDFMVADVNNDKFIDLKEWQGTYIASIDTANKLKAHINK